MGRCYKQIADASIVTMVKRRQRTAALAAERRIAAQYRSTRVRALDSRLVERMLDDLQGAVNAHTRRVDEEWRRRFAATSGIVRLFIANARAMRRARRLHAIHLS